MSNAALPTVAPSAPHGGHGRMHLLMLFVIVCWSSNIIAGKEALTQMSAPALAQLRVLGSAIIFAFAFLVTGRWQRLRISRQSMLFLVVTAFFGITLNQLTFIGGMAHSNVAHTGLLVALEPAMVLVIAVAARMEDLTASKAIGMIIAFAGVAVLTTEKVGPAGSGHGVGDLILLVSTIVFSIYVVMMKKVANQFDSLTLNALIFVPGALMMLPFCTGSVVALRWSGIGLKAWCGLGFLILFGTVISYLLFARVMAELAASRVAAFNYLQPVIASGLGVWLLSERLTSKVFLGGGLILAGVYLTENERGEEKKCPLPGVPERVSKPV